MTILVWGLLLEILCVVYLASTPWRFEFAYSVFLLVFTSVALAFMIWRLRTYRSKAHPQIAEPGGSYANL